MRALFYRHGKKLNSTRLPVLPGIAYDVTLKDDTSVLQPDIVLKWTPPAEPYNFNYVYIEEFARYYWISNWTYSERCWVASCSVDVLGSYRTQIGNSSRYVLRSASQYDPHVLDILYPATGESEDLTWTGSYAIPTEPLYGGCFILSVSGAVGTDPDTGMAFPSLAGMGYYVCTVSEISEVIATAFNDIKTYIKGDPASDPVSTIEQVMKWIGNSFIKTAANVVEYINGIMWLPVNPGSVADMTTNANVYLGMINCGTAHPMTSSTAQFSMSFNLSNIGSGQDWEWLYPYTHYTFELLPFGVIPLDPLPILQYKQLQAIIKIDTITGLAVLKINAVQEGAVQYLIAERSAQLGIPIQLAGYTYDFVGALASVTGGVSGAITSLQQGDVSSMLYSIGNAAKGAMPDAYSDGRSGGAAAIETIATVHCRHLLHVPQDIPDNGRPLCDTVQISLLSGYVQCADGHMIIAGATDGELEQLEQYLTGGFFYE